MTNKQHAVELPGGDREHLETDRLAELIGEKYRILEDLRELSRRQADLISQGDMNRLLTVLSAKQRLLAELQRTERLLDPFREQDPAGRQWRSPEQRTQCRRMAERCQALLGEVMLAEKQCESDLMRRRDEAASRLQGAHHASCARDAYTQADEPPSRQIDLTCDG